MLCNFKRNSASGCSLDNFSSMVVPFSKVLQKYIVEEKNGEKSIYNFLQGLIAIVPPMLPHYFNKNNNGWCVLHSYQGARNDPKSHILSIDNEVTLNKPPHRTGRGEPKSRKRPQVGTDVIAPSLVKCFSQCVVNHKRGLIRSPLIWDTDLRSVAGWAFIQVTKLS